MKEFLRDKKEVFAIIAYMALVVALVYFIVLPIRKKITETSDQIQKDMADQKINSQRIGDLSKIRQQFEILAAKEGELDVLLKNGNVVPLIEYLEKMAADTGNKVKITAQENQAPPKPTTATKGKAAAPDTSIKGTLPSNDYLSMNLSLTGKYADTIRFIDMLENARYYCDIVAIQFKSTEEEPSESSSVEFPDPFGQTESASSVSKPAKQAVARALVVNASIDVVFYVKK